MHRSKRQIITSAILSVFLVSTLAATSVLISNPNYSLDIRNYAKQMEYGDEGGYTNKQTVKAPAKADKPSKPSKSSNDLEEEEQIHAQQANTPVASTPTPKPVQGPPTPPPKDERDPITAPVVVKPTLAPLVNADKWADEPAISTVIIKDSNGKVITNEQYQASLKASAPPSVTYSYTETSNTGAVTNVTSSNDHNQVVKETKDEETGTTKTEVIVVTPTNNTDYVKTNKVITTDEDDNVIESQTTTTKTVTQTTPTIISGNTVETKTITTTDTATGNVVDKVVVTAATPAPVVTNSQESEVFWQQAAANPQLAYVAPAGLGATNIPTPINAPSSTNSPTEPVAQYGICQDKPTEAEKAECNQNLTKIQNVANTLTLKNFNSYADAWNPGNVKYAWQEKYQSLEECQSANPGRGSAYCSGIDVTAEQFGSTVKLGTTITAELAILASGAGLATGALTTSGAGANLIAINAVSKAGSATKSCSIDPGSEKCTKDAIYFALSAANLGSYSYVTQAGQAAQAIGAGEAAAQELVKARLVNAGVSTLETAKNIYLTKESCVGEKANGLDCALGATTTALSIYTNSPDIKYALNTAINKTIVAPINNAVLTGLSEDVLTPSNFQFAPLPAKIVLPEAVQGAKLAITTQRILRPASSSTFTRTPFDIVGTAQDNLNINMSLEPSITDPIIMAQESLQLNHDLVFEPIMYPN